MYVCVYIIKNINNNNDKYSQINKILNHLQDVRSTCLNIVVSDGRLRVVFSS